MGTPKEPAAGSTSRPPRWARKNRVVLTTGLLFLGSFLVFLAPIENPERVAFDEVHYVRAARAYANGTLINPESGDRALPYNFEHPPFVKWLMAGSISLFGDVPVGWRFPSALMGALSIASVAILGRRLYGSEPAGLAAAGILLLDNVFYIETQLAMLDATVVALTLLAFAMVMGEHTERRASAVVFGLALASKFTAGFLLPLFLGLHWLRQGADLPRELKFARTVAWSLAVPAAVLLATYVPFFVAWSATGGFGYALGRFTDVQAALLTWHLGTEVSHECETPPWTWFFFLRPTYIYRRTFADTDTVAYIHTVGNPILWWSALIGAVAFLGLLLWRLAKDRNLAWRPFLRTLRWEPARWTLPTRIALAAVFVIAAYLPFFLLARLTFHFYMMGIVPWLALVAAGLVLWAWQRGPRWQRGAMVYMGLLLVAFVVWYPISEGVPISRGYYQFLKSLMPWSTLGCPH